MRRQVVSACPPVGPSLSRPRRRGTSAGDVANDHAAALAHGRGVPISAIAARHAVGDRVVADGPCRSLSRIASFASYVLDGPPTQVDDVGRNAAKSLNEQAGRAAYAMLRGRASGT